MTVTEARPGEAGAVETPAPTSPASGEQGAREVAPMAAAADHKRLGLVFLVAATTFLVLGV
ncbi:MAG TPA: hypothetical protein VKI20_11370, partial [Acidimicrobiales bacterium]|nr:hypothetical protein [Acidimicrobiales bacterium]